MTLKVSISGIRGIYGDSLTDDTCRNFIRAYAAFIKKGKVVIGMDTRASSSPLKSIAVKELVKLGFTVLDAGISPTPTIGNAVRDLKASGGIVITASHNPEPWNGLKFMRRDGTFLNTKEGTQLISIYHSSAFPSLKNGGKAIQMRRRIHALHINKVLRNVDVKKIRSRNFKVALDSVNGAGSRITLLLLNKLGCKISSLYTKEKSPFPRPPEPTPQNLKDLCIKVKKNKSAVGFAQDPDADRLALVDDKGRPISEEYTLVLGALAALKDTKKGKVIVANLSTTSALEIIAARFGAKVVRTKVGEAHVVEGMMKNRALIGGEGNGGVIFPKISYNRDSLAGIALVLELLAAYAQPLSKIMRSLPHFFSEKIKLDLIDQADSIQILKCLKEKFKRNRIDLTEGIKIFFPDAWAHIRPSNTEPIIRIIAEAKNPRQAKKITRQIKGLCADFL